MSRARNASPRRQRCSGCFRYAETNGRCDSCARSPGYEDVLSAGTCLLQGRYEFGLPLGTPGGFGITYHGWDSQLDRRVAIKEFFPREIACRSGNRSAITAIRTEAQSTLQQQLDGFLDEARRAAQIEHDHVVRILDFTEENGTGYIVMPFYEGETLSEYRLRQAGQRIEWKQAVNLMFPILSALDAVHEAEMIHRDVKPSNIYLASTKHGTPKPILIDFGSSRIVAASRELTGILTQGYAPLEQYDPSGKGQGPWTDVYAAAATLFELISGEVPPSSPARQLGRALTDLRTISGDIPRELQTALDCALRLDPDQRTKNVDLLVRAIAAATGLSPTRRTSRGSPSARKTSVVGALSLIAGGMTLAVAAAWWANDSRNATLTTVTPHQQDARSPGSSVTGMSIDANANNVSRSGSVTGREDTRSEMNTRVSTKKQNASSDTVSLSKRNDRRTRATALRDGGDYIGAWNLTEAAEDSALRSSIRNACRTDSTISARRSTLVHCPPD